MDKNNKLGWTLLPKCASTSMRVIQLVKSGFYTGRENFRNHKAKEMWPVIPEKHHVHKIDSRNRDFEGSHLWNLILKWLILKKIENFIQKSLISGILPDLSDYKFITVIRHPLKRLVSAYSDKIGRGSTRVSRQYYWHSYGREIISRYRKNYPNLTQGQWFNDNPLRQHLH